MPLRLSTTDVAEALAGLSPDERAELHGLLEARERLRVEPPPDTRPSIQTFAEQQRQEHAARSVDPDAWLAADEAHNRAYQAHLDRLRASGTAHPCDGIEAWLAELFAAMDEATALTAADGIPTADEVVPPRSRAVVITDGVSTATLPPAVRDDIEFTRAVSKRSTKAPLVPVPFVAPIIDVLGPYRGTGMSDDEQQAEDR